jgi:hypothetical protein
MFQFDACELNRVEKYEIWFYIYYVVNGICRTLSNATVSEGIKVFYVTGKKTAGSSYMYNYSSESDIVYFSDIHAQCSYGAVCYMVT